MLPGLGRQRDGWMLLSSFILLFLGGVSISHAKGIFSGEYCDTEVFRAECPEGEVIIMERARYGRLRLGRCVEIDLGHIGCFTDVLHLTDRRCSGKRVCEIRIPDAEFESTRPCLKELKTYLEASYQCVAVETVTTEYCKANDQLNVTSLFGYIASVVTSDTPHCDGSSHPWLITSSPGQQVNLTLYDFALDRTVSRTQPSTDHVTELGCLQYGLIEDSGRDKPTAICGGNRRVNPIYRSVGNVVKIWVTAGAAPTDLKRFAIHYSVVGCADPIVPAHAWLKRTPDGSALVGCKHSDNTAPLICNPDHKWRGSFLNCSLPEPVADKEVASTDTPPVSYVMAAGVLIACLSAVILIIFIIVGCRQRRRRGAARDSVILRKRQTESDCRETAYSKESAPSRPLVNSTRNSPGTDPRQQRHQVTVNGNDYEHIWQSDCSTRLQTDGNSPRTLTSFKPHIAGSPVNGGNPALKDGQRSIRPQTTIDR